MSGAAGAATSAARDTGAVEAIFIGAAHEALPGAVDEAEAVPAAGLRGDRHYDEAPSAEPGRDLTLIEAEAIEGLEAEHGVSIEPAEARRNVLTRGIDLNALVGKRFRVGEVECLGQELCEPCAHLQSLTKPGVLRGLVHRGGLRADILNPGRIRVGDTVSAA
jgi:MOSC domain-containing protein YiiM